MDVLLTDGASGADNTAPQLGAIESPAPAGGDGASTPVVAGEGALGSFFDSLPEDIRNSIPEDLRGSEDFKGEGGLEALLKKHQDMAKTLKDLPKAPETADAYEVPLLEGATVDPEYLAGFKGTAHELGLTQAQVEGLAKWQNGFLKSVGEKTEAQVAEAKAKATELGMEALKKPEKEGGFGADYDMKLDHAKRGFANIVRGNAELEAWARDPRVGSDPMMVKLFAQAYSKMSEDSLDGTRGGAAAARPKTADGSPMLTFPSMDKK